MPNGLPRWAAYNLLTRANRLHRVAALVPEDSAMSKRKLTKKEIDRIPRPAAGQEIYWDTELEGFGLRVTPSRMTYIASKPLADTTRGDCERAMHVGFNAWRNPPIVHITGAMVSRRFEELSENGPGANQKFRFLRALLGWAIWRFAQDDGTPLLSTNPCDVLTKLH